MKYLFVGLVFCTIFSTFVHAKWVWTPDTGWINAEHSPRGTVQDLFKRAQDLEQQKKITEAIQVYKSIWQYYANTPEAEKALYTSAELEYDRKNYLKAYNLYSKFVLTYPANKNYSPATERMYNIGAKVIRGETSAEPESGIEMLESVIAKSPFATFADDAHMTIANYYYKNEMYQEAQDKYKEVVKKYPDGEWTKTAQYFIAQCSIKMFRGSSFDDTPLNDAKKELNRYFDKYSDMTLEEAASHKITKDADRNTLPLPIRAYNKLQEIEEKMAEKELEVALFYRDREKFKSARVYFYYIVKKFPKTKAAKRAKVILKTLPKENQ